MNQNDAQVGGTHYKTPFQHWDLTHELGLGYFEGQITKYITRHRNKKGKEDLEKAFHFTKKLKELVVLSDHMPCHRYGTVARFAEYAEANRLLPMELMCVMSACNWMVAADLDILLERMNKLMAECYPSFPSVPDLQSHWPFDGPTASGYVDQDR